MIRCFLLIFGSKLLFQLLLFLIIITRIYTIEFFALSLVDHAEIVIPHNAHDNTRNVRVRQLIYRLMFCDKRLCYELEHLLQMLYRQVLN